jgi:hypothetical protein
VFSNRIANTVWRSELPLKIKFFLWQMINNKLQAAQVLKRRGRKGDGIAS